MKVLLVSPLPPPSGGLATWTEELVKYTSRTELEIDVVNTSLTGQRATLKGGKIHISDELSRSIRIIRDMIKHISQKKYDAVHVNTVCSTKGMLRDLICMCVCGRTPIVLQCHCNVSDWIGQKKAAIFLFRELAKRAERILVLNSQSQIAVKEITGRESICVPNFLASDLQHSKQKTVRERIEQVVYVGRVRAAKGMVELLETANQMPDVHFTVIGSVDDEISGKKIPSNVCLAGEKSHAEVEEELEKADVFLFPSYSEGFSIALLEAMRAGLPVVATDVGANADMLGDRGGVIVAARNVAEIVNALRSIQSPEIRRGMSEHNIQKVRDTYSVCAVVDTLKTIYDAVQPKGHSL